MIILQCTAFVVIAFISLGMGFFAWENAMKIGVRTYGRNAMTAIFTGFSSCAMSVATSVWTGSLVTHLIAVVATCGTIYMFTVVAKPIRQPRQQVQPQ